MDILRRDLAKLREEITYLASLIRKNEAEIKRLEQELRDLK